MSALSPRNPWSESLAAYVAAQLTVNAGTLDGGVKWTGEALKGAILMTLEGPDGLRFKRRARLRGGHVRYIGPSSDARPNATPQGAANVALELAVLLFSDALRRNRIRQTLRTFDEGPERFLALYHELTGHWAAAFAADDSQTCVALEETIAAVAALIPRHIRETLTPVFYPSKRESRMYEDEEVGGAE